MFKSYDSTLRAYTEHPPKNYDAALGAWVDSPSAKTFGTAQNSWVERLYQDYFTLTRNSLYPLLRDGDILEVSKSGFVFNTFSTGLLRRIEFELPYKYSHGDIVEFDIVTNSLGEVGIGSEFNLVGGSTVSSSVIVLDGAYNEHVTASVFGSVPDTYEGSEVKSSYITVYSTISAEEATGETYLELRNFKINGKKYGFTE